MQFLDAVTAMIPVVAKFKRLGIRYYVSGSLASSIYGLSRTTLDVDIVAELRREHVAPLVATLQSAYYVSEPMILDAVAPKSCFNVIYLAKCFEVDVFVSKGREYDLTVFQRIRQRILLIPGTDQSGSLPIAERLGAGEVGMVSPWRRSVGSAMARHHRSDDDTAQRAGSVLPRSLGRPATGGRFAGKGMDAS
jgi:hypothetical protein